MSSVFLTKSGPLTNAASRIHSLLEASNPSAVCMASAFLSEGGAQSYHELLCAGRGQASYVVVGLSGEVTHPRAIEYLAENGHSVRCYKLSAGIFHPKILVGGNSFDSSGQMNGACCSYVGSANFTRGGLFNNLEVILATTDQIISEGIARAFKEIWCSASQLTPDLLLDYERAFARAQRKRSVSDIELLDVGTGINEGVSLFPTNLCRAVWAGLESSTGEHTFQVEFPKKAGEALKTLLNAETGNVNILCTDGETRAMGFRYYSDNGMYRLNVPNSVPLVAWARLSRQGALMVWKEEADDDNLMAEIIRGKRLDDAIERSTVLNTLGNTSTRKYGWF